MAKIESAAGIHEFSSIVQAADGILIARGDLGIQLPFVQVPKLQKMMLRVCHEVGKPTILATQMLESMLYHPRPTRAEACDVANAVYEGATAAMLSEETAAGAYPIDSVAVMSSIIQETETDVDYYNFFQHRFHHETHEIKDCIAQAAVHTAYRVEAKAIFVYTVTGAAAIKLSHFRPQMPIVALTHDPYIYHQLALYWGLIPLLVPHILNMDQVYHYLKTYACEQKIVHVGDRVVMIASALTATPDATNLLIVESI